MLQGVYILMPLLVFQNMLPSHPGRAPSRSTKPGDVYHSGARAEARRWWWAGSGGVGAIELYGQLWLDLQGAFCPEPDLGAERAEEEEEEKEEEESGVAASAALPPPPSNSAVDFCKWFQVATGGG